jgi:hypothetical protein
MWALEFCHNRASDCLQIAEDCKDAGQRRAWLELAREWAKLSEEVMASNHGRARRTSVAEASAGARPQAQISEDRARVLPVGTGGEEPA